MLTWHLVGFLWKESLSKLPAQGGADELRWPQPRGRRQGPGSRTVLSPASRASEPVTAAVCVVVVVVVVKVAGSTHSWFTVYSLRRLGGRGEAWSPEQGGEFLDAAFTAPADV